MENVPSKYEEMETGFMPVEVTVLDKIGIGFGSISAPEMSQLDAETEAREAATFLKKIDWRSPAVCIDGRHLAEGEQALPLGSHLAGAVETPLVAAKSIEYKLQGAELVAFLKGEGFTLGAHDADSNKANNYENGSGCGACDKCEGNCGLYAENKEKVEGTVAALTGPDFSKEAFDTVSLAPFTDSVHAIVGEELVETLHDDHEGVHGHHERMVVFNYVEDTTIDRDAYIDATTSEEFPNGKQLFVVDMWYLKKLAHAMSPEDTRQAAELYHAMTAFQVATYLGLCDGKHRAVVIQPKQAA